jgi:hypothetical protein
MFLKLSVVSAFFKWGMGPSEILQKRCPVGTIRVTHLKISQGFLAKLWRMCWVSNNRSVPTTSKLKTKIINLNTDVCSALLKNTH